jgi:hypothetical protein
MEPNEARASDEIHDEKKNGDGQQKRGVAGARQARPHPLGGTEVGLGAIG